MIAVHGAFPPTPFIYVFQKHPKLLFHDMFHYADTHSTLLRNTYVPTAFVIKAPFKLRHPFHPSTQLVSDCLGWGNIGSIKLFFGKETIFIQQFRKGILTHI